MRFAFATLLVFCISIAGCESPEATRTSGGGPGGDTGNRPAIVKMHEGSRQYWGTPKSIPGESDSLEPARQAQQGSQP